MKRRACAIKIPILDYFLEKLNFTRLEMADRLLIFYMSHSLFVKRIIAKRLTLYAQKWIIHPEVDLEGVQKVSE